MSGILSTPKNERLSEKEIRECFRNQNFIIEIPRSPYSAEKLPKNTVRDSANFFIIFPQDKMDWITYEFLEFSKEV